MIKQVVILCGGLGTRLGSYTQNKHKSLLPIGNAPFMDLLVDEVSRQGFNDVIFLAGHFSEQIAHYAINSSMAKRRGIRLRLSIENSPLGTGGAIQEAQGLLDDQFLLMNGDSWFDINLREFASKASSSSHHIMSLALKSMKNNSRYGAVNISGENIIEFHEKEANERDGLINGGIYYCDKHKLLDEISLLSSHSKKPLSLEKEIMPRLAYHGLLGGQIFDSYFIDIGLNETFIQAQTEIPIVQKRPAVFFDRDGVLNENLGHVGTKERFNWIEGAIEAIKICNDYGYYTFVVTNQAGVAKGFYGEEEVKELHHYMQEILSNHGAYVDDFRYCPYHEQAVIPKYRKKSKWRKPAPGMIEDIFENWNVEKSTSFFIGDSDTDILAASEAGITGYHFSGGNLFKFLMGISEFKSHRNSFFVI